ncbi:hypothetical protein BDQ94DRAFT_155783 [Aspergillus welwitschiae]|uniref:RNase III domain-containing protein n=1 Tax=Aspergillus welwitschiae TaxID=1341132 RepID=A0A3F3PHR2_9EURO|nr:hypothetical protein BDQ94DRAFT_155783 [Aspergillus welwitschiae]RDH26283.1 hypothetical protein BDQ94DRAFT_155783 [Aspergillus welwitschiae]
MTSVRSKLIDSIQDRLGVSFENSTLIHEAFMAASAVGRDSRARHESRKQINQIVSRIASNRNLAQRGFELGLDRCVCKNLSQGNFVSDKLMATTVEAIAGAVFLETSWDRAALQRIVDALGLAWPDSCARIFPCKARIITDLLSSIIAY